MIGSVMVSPFPLTLPYGLACDHALGRAVLPINSGHRGLCFGMHGISQGKSRATEVGMCPKAPGCPAKRLKPPPGFCEPQGVFGRVAGRDRGWETGRPGNRRPAGVARKL